MLDSFPDDPSPPMTEPAESRGTDEPREQNRGKECYEPVGFVSGKYRPGTRVSYQRPDAALEH